MSLRLIYGKAGSGKTNYCFNEIKKRINENEKIYIITPEQFSFTEEKNLLNAVEQNSVVNAEVLTFGRMAFRIMQDVGGATKIPLSDASTSILLYDVLDREKDKLVFLGKNNKNIDIVKRIFTELKKHKIKNEQLQDAIKNTENYALKKKLEDILLLKKSFELNIPTEYIEGEDTLGMLEKGTKLPCIAHEHTGESNSNMVFSEYDIEENECPLMLFSYSQLKSRNVFQSINCAFIKYKDSTSYETLLDDQKQITRLGGVFSATLSEINDNSISYFKVQIFNYLPIIIVVLILTLVSSISITALSTRRRLHDYGIYFLCGLKWKSCCLVNLFWALMAESAAVIAAALFITFSGRLSLIGKITVLPNIFTFSAAAAVLLIFTAGSMLMPLIIIGNSTPKEILSRGDA